MAEPVGITGTALTVASLLYSSCQTVCEIIDSYKKAPKEYQDLTLSLRTLQNSLGTLRNSLQGTGDAPLSQEQRDSLVDLALPLEICNAACEDFKSKLSKLTSNSTIDHTAFWDKLRLHFNKNDVAFLEGKLSSAKSTVIMALGVLSLKALAQTKAALTTFQDSTAATMSEFSGRVEALALAIQSLSISGVQSTQKDVEIVRQTLDDHEKLLRHCLVFCTTALSAAQTVLPGTQVKHAKALNHARQIVGNFGPLGKNAPPVVVDTAEAQDAFQAVGNIDLRGLDTRALDFLAGK